MSSPKPLPAIPTITQLSTLSVQARDHRSKLIRHFLSEFYDSTVESSREAWAGALENSLDQLSNAIAGDDWLAGIRKARATRRRRDIKGASESKLLSSNQTSSSISNNGGHRGSVSSHEKENSDPAERSTVERPAESQSERNARALEQIRALLAKPTTPTPNTMSKHVLLCLAPLGSRIALPREDSGFDIIPANIGCVFTPGVFALPELDADSPNSALYGLNEWNSEHLVACILSSA